MGEPGHRTTLAGEHAEGVFRHVQALPVSCSPWGTPGDDNTVDMQFFCLAMSATWESPLMS